MAKIFEMPPSSKSGGSRDPLLGEQPGEAGVLEMPHRQEEPRELSSEERARAAIESRQELARQNAEKLKWNLDLARKQRESGGIERGEMLHTFNAGERTLLLGNEGEDKGLLMKVYEDPRWRERASDLELEYTKALTEAVTAAQRLDDVRKQIAILAEAAEGKKEVANG